MHFQDDCLGKQGSSATFPSARDMVELSHLQNHPVGPHTPQSCPTELRTIESYENFYNENVCETRREGDLNATGKYHGSVVRRPIFPLLNLDNLIPPVLHITLGIVLKLFNMLESATKNLDAPTKKVPAKIKYEKELSEALKKLTQVDQKVREQGSSFIDYFNFRERLDAYFSGESSEVDSIALHQTATRKSASENEHCTSIHCFISNFDAEVDWIDCTTCGGWKHALCECLSASEFLEKSREDYTCLGCAGVQIDHLRPHVESKLERLRSTQKKLEIDAQSLRDRVWFLEAEVEDGMGPLQSRLISILDEIKVERQAYHGKAFVGNHCKLILKNHELVCSVLSTSPDLHTKFVDIFSIFAEVQPLLFRKNYLTVVEIARVKYLCNLFGERYPVCFPDETITRKMHELIFDVPRFLENHNTVGLYSEEEGESIHNAINQELRQLCCVRNNAQKLKLLLRRQELRGRADRSLLVPVRRLCQRCLVGGVSTFLRQGKCNICDLEQ